MNFSQPFRASRGLTVRPKSFRLLTRFALYTAISLTLCASMLGVRSGKTASLVPVETNFTTSPLYPVGAHPYAIASFKDVLGEPVLAVTNNTDDTVSVLFARSSPPYGSFTTTRTVNLPAGAQPQGIVYATIGQSKKSSLVIAESWPSLAKGKVMVIPVSYSFDFSGTFGTPTEYAVGLFPESVATGDFNGDGIEDIVAANYGESTISLLIGNADETFQPAITLPNPISQNPEFIVAKDFDVDGKIDLATCNTGAAVQANKVNVLLGNGDGTFKAPAVYSVGSTASGATPFFLTAADFNNDGRPDIATSNHNTDEVSVLLNTGAGAFSLIGNIPLGASADPYAIVADDFNLDTYADLAVASPGDHRIRVLLNNQDATFQPPVLIDVGTNPFGVAVGDFNLDRRPDIAVANNGSNNVLALLNTAVPPNDLFVNATPISGASGTQLGINAGATRELDEPGTAQGPSVWYKWQAPIDGTATFDVSVIDFPNISFTVYEGSTLTALTTLGSSDEFSTVWFTATAGTVYRIVVTGTADDDRNSSGSFKLNWSMTQPPANDLFVNATPITTPTGNMDVSNVGAASEPGESLGRSIWFKWQAPSNGAMTFSTTGSGIDYTVLGIYTGNAVNALTPVASDIGLPASVTFGVLGGTLYHIRLDCGPSGRAATMTLTWQFSPPPGNDDLLNAENLIGIPGKINANNFGASSQQNENLHDGVQGGSSVWFQWTALDNQRVTFATWGSSIDTLLAVYEGSAFPLTKIVSNNDDAGEHCSPNASRVSFNPEAGKTYKIAVDGVGGVSGRLVLRWGYSRAISASLFSAFLFGDACRDFGGAPIGGLPSGGSYFVSTDASNFVRFTTGSLSPLVNDVQVYFFHTIPTFGIKGTVTGPSGLPPSVSIKATINDAPAGLVPSTFAAYDAATGNFSFGDGYWSDYSYTVTATAPNYVLMATTNALHVSGAGGTFQIVNFVANPVPTTTTSTQTNVTSNAATLNGIINPNGVTTSGWFEWGTDPTLATSNSTAPQALGSGTTNQALTADLSGLAANTTYYFRAVGMNSAGTSKGTILSFTTSGSTVQFTVQTNPTGRSFSVDGTSYTSAQSFNWIAGSNHTISTTSTQAGATGTQYVWTKWSDGLAISHGITVPNASTTYTATFDTQHMLTMNAGTGGGVSPLTAFFNSGQNVQITATANSGFIFNGWTGTGAGSFTGTSNPATVTMTGPITQTASFTSVNALRLVLETPGSIPDQVLALDATSSLRDPFPIVNPLGWWSNSSDKNTRLIIFLQNFQPASNEPASAVVVNLTGTNNQTIEVQAEDVRVLDGTVDDQVIYQVTFRLPDLSMGTWAIKVKAHGETSNSGSLRIKL